MNAAAATLQTPQVAPEDQARADFYALLARLFYAGPDAKLMAAVAGADELVAEGGDAKVAEAWRDLVAAAAATDPEAAREEYDLVFIGTGKAEVTPFAAHYMTRTGAEMVLARLRGELAQIGLQRSPSAREPEDHFAALCDVMRHLIMAGGGGDAALQEESRFFEAYIRPGFEAFCDAILASQNTNFYKPVARFAKAFFAIEVESFGML
jgi:TorA maturation chaperone TorD